MELTPLPDEFPVLDAGEFTLRRVEVSDAADWYSYLIDDEGSRYTRTKVRDLPEIEDAARVWQQRFADKAAIRWAIARKNDNRMIGETGFNRLDSYNRSAMLGYALSRENWGRGVATTCVNEVVRFAFERLDAHRIEATVQTENRRSVRVLEKLGFRLEGTLRDYRYAEGAFFDSFVFGLLEGEWRDVSG